MLACPGCPDIHAFFGSMLFAYTLMNTSFVIATKWTAAANAIALQYTAPLWIFAGALLARSVRPTPRRLLPMALIAGGIVSFILEPASGTSLKGNIAALVSGIGFALTIVGFRILRDDHNYSLVMKS